MAETWQLLIAGIAGSGLTILLSKLFEFIQHKQLFKRELKKLYFNKKIDAFERVSIQYSKLISSLYSLESLFKNTFEERDEIQRASFNSTLKNFNTILINASKQAYELSTSLIIYFDIDDKWFKELININDILKMSENIKEIQYQMDQYYDQLTPLDDESKNVPADNTIESLKVQLEKLEKDISLHFGQSKNSMISIQRKIREQLIKYEN